MSVTDGLLVGWPVQRYERRTHTLQVGQAGLHSSRPNQRREAVNDEKLSVSAAVGQLKVVLLIGHIQLEQYVGRCGQGAVGARQAHYLRATLAGEFSAFAQCLGLPGHRNDEEHVLGVRGRCRHTLPIGVDQSRREYIEAK
ncbi:hypothetical protein D3C71_1431760 [compost metagenome]